MNDEKKFTLEEAQRELAKKSNHRVWELLEKSKRSPEEDKEMLLAAMTSYYHWKQIGTAVNDQRGLWILSRVYIVLGQSQEALELAKKCQEVTESYPDEMKDFDLAFAQEGLARAYASAGDLEKAKKHYNLAFKLGENIKDPDDKKIFRDDLQGGDWFGLK
jgi:tetratricopeptide (TPR) repeat protein